MRQSKYEFCFNIYIIFLFIFSVIFLYQKHNGSVDWNISEWLINYQGGFTRRGLLGESALLMSNLFNVSIRKIILLFQIISVGLYLTLTFYFLKNIKKYYLLIFAIFSPVYLLYPVAELESLGRKEILLFIFYLIFINFNLKNTENYKNYLLIFFLLPLICLIWEGSVIYFIYFLTIAVVNQLPKKKINYLILFFSFLPCIGTFIFIVLSSKLSTAQIMQICISINEECYGAMKYLSHSLNDNISEVIIKFKFEYFLRYFFAFILGYLPLFILINISKFKKNICAISLQKLYLILITSNFIFYFIAIDWARWINISYVMNILLYFYLVKSKKIIINVKNKFFYKFENSSQKFLLFMFIFFSFGWNIKTTISETLGSFPLYRVLAKFYKYFL